MKDIKPEYCNDTNQECSDCEIFKNGECSLTEEHIEVLNAVTKRKKNK